MNMYYRRHQKKERKKKRKKKRGKKKGKRREKKKVQPSVLLSSLTRNSNNVRKVRARLSRECQNDKSTTVLGSEKPAGLAKKNIKSCRCVGSALSMIRQIGDNHKESQGAGRKKSKELSVKEILSASEGLHPRHRRSLDHYVVRDYLYILVQAVSR